MFKKIFIMLLACSSLLFSALTDKSAMVYYGKDISYPMVGIADYIIVQADNTNTYTHGFDVYKNKMYAYVSIGEIDTDIPEYKKINKKWIIANNKSWGSKVLDIRDKDYRNFLFDIMIEPKLKKGFENFFFDTLDSYQLACKTKHEKKEYEDALASFIHEFHIRYPQSKLIINRGFEIIDQVHDAIEAVLFESYYKGIDGKNLAYQDVSKSDRKWLDFYIDKIKSYSKDIICVDYLPTEKLAQGKKIVAKLQLRGLIPYISNRELTQYGISSKNAVKREVLTLIDENILDRTLQSAHQYGALPLEYLGYIQKLYDISKGLPKIENMHHYAGVVIWLRDNYKDADKLVTWIKKLENIGIKVVFVENFAIEQSKTALNLLDVDLQDNQSKREKVIFQDKMVGFEIDPPLSFSGVNIKSKNIKPLLVYGNKDGSTSTPMAITSWGGYAVENSFTLDIENDNILLVNPFLFFKEALDLATLPVPDPTTENGKRLLFTHIDGDGIMNRVESNPQEFSGQSILDNILKVYKIPHSASIIGAEVDKNGLYPKISNELITIVKKIYALKNVEPATHTFAHPFFWGEIKNGKLDKKYRLKVKNYSFSLQRELQQPLININKNYNPTHKAKTVFWSGDCIPRSNALEYVYQHKILNINGGDTAISNMTPWLTMVAPLGIARGEYYQIYTGAQNENVYTDEWRGPFWGFKQAVQTYKLTNSPRRLKPIDIYYHFYSGSKTASLEALKFVFSWAIDQDVIPIFTSEYIPKVMDYYTVSMAKSHEGWFVDGMKDLKTLRIEEKNININLEKSLSVLGYKHFEGHTYISLSNKVKHFVVTSKVQQEMPYLISANAKIIDYKKNINKEVFSFQGHVDLNLEFYLPKNYEIHSNMKIAKTINRNSRVRLYYRDISQAKIEIKYKKK